jgi:hypothetical protein
VVLGEAADALARHPRMPDESAATLQVADGCAGQCRGKLSRCAPHPCAFHAPLQPEACRPALSRLQIVLTVLRNLLVIPDPDSVRGHGRGPWMGVEHPAKPGKDCQLSPARMLVAPPCERPAVVSRWLHTLAPHAGERGRQWAPGCCRTWGEWCRPCGQPALGGSQRARGVSRGGQRREWAACTAAGGAGGGGGLGATHSRVHARCGGWSGGSGADGWASGRTVIQRPA